MTWRGKLYVLRALIHWTTSLEGARRRTLITTSLAVKSFFVVIKTLDIWNGKSVEDEEIYRVKREQKLKMIALAIISSFVLFSL